MLWYVCAMGCKKLYFDLSDNLDFNRFVITQYIIPQERRWKKWLKMKNELLPP